jgi:hypothetical protein
VPQLDLVGCIVDGLRSRGAGPVDGIGRNAGRELGQQAHLPSHVGGKDRRYDLAEHHFVDFLSVHLAAVQQFPRGVARQGDGGDVTKDGTALGKRCADAGDDCHPPARADIDQCCPEKGRG